MIYLLAAATLATILIGKLFGWFPANRPARGHRIDIVPHEDGTASAYVDDVEVLVAATPQMAFDAIRNTMEGLGMDMREIT